MLLHQKYSGSPVCTIHCGFLPGNSANCFTFGKAEVETAVTKSLCARKPGEQGHSFPYGCSVSAGVAGALLWRTAFETPSRQPLVQWLNKGLLTVIEKP